MQVELITIFGIFTETLTLCSLDIGRQHALRLLGTSIKISAIEALQLGLVDGIVDSPGSELPQSETVKVYDYDFNTLKIPFIL
jgi:enoyl-CoA hydratase/carnithine racemase